MYVQMDAVFRKASKDLQNQSSLVLRPENEKLVRGVQH